MNFKLHFRIVTLITAGSFMLNESEIFTYHQRMKQLGFWFNLLVQGEGIK